MFNWNPFFLSVSVDDGRSWTGEWPMNLLGGPYHDAMTARVRHKLTPYSRNHMEQ